MAKTRNGIYYNFYETEYYTIIADYVFYFSSELYREKFEEELQINRDTLSYSIFKRYKIDTNLNALFDLYLYSNIEKRGFRINYKGRDYSCLRKVKLGGLVMIEN